LWPAFKLEKELLSLVNTLNYMSPELIKGEPVNNKTDIWSFGCILYEMLTLEKAFKRDTYLEMANEIIKHDLDLSLSRIGQKMKPILERYQVFMLPLVYTNSRINNLNL
jgi:serine/threonine protein kinase